MNYIKRTTTETDIVLKINGQRTVTTKNAMWQHLLTQLVNLGPDPLSLEISGDESIDMHHTLEDSGYVLGRYLALKAAKSNGKLLN